MWIDALGSDKIIKVEEVSWSMSKENSTSFGQNLRKYRVMEGLSQEELASKSGLSRNFISDLETSKKQPSYDAVKKLAKALGISLDQISYDLDTVSDDYYIKESLMIRSRMSEKKRRVADRLGLKLLEEILNMPDD